MWYCWPGICIIKKIMWYSILLKLSISLWYSSFIQLSTPPFFFLHIVKFFSIYLSHVEALFFFFFIGTHSCKSKKMAIIYGQRKEEWIWFACQVLFLAIFFDNSWRIFNASSFISSRMKLFEYHASSWHGHASHLMVFWLMSSH